MDRGNLPSPALLEGGRSSMVESQLVELAVAGSSPVGHPISVGGRIFKKAFENGACRPTAFDKEFFMATNKRQKVG